LKVPGNKQPFFQPVHHEFDLTDSSRALSGVACIFCRPDWPLAGGTGFRASSGADPEEALRWVSNRHEKEGRALDEYRAVLSRRFGKWTHHRQGAYQSKAETFEEAQRESNYVYRGPRSKRLTAEDGVGWSRIERSWVCGTALTQNGTNTMNYAVMWLATDKKFAAVAACNMDSGLGALACDAAVSFLIGKFLKCGGGRKRGWENAGIPRMPPDC